MIGLDYDSDRPMQLSGFLHVTHAHFATGFKVEYFDSK